jgi:hypothetical protein
MRGNNFGGLKATGGEPSAALTTHEGHGAARRRIRDSFRTYASPVDGATDYVRTLSQRYPEATRAAAAGDAAGFVRGLETRRYFTGAAEDYQRAVGSLAREHQRAHATGGVGSVGAGAPGVMPSSGPESTGAASAVNAAPPVDVAAPPWAVEGVSKALWQAVWKRRG